ncbi:MAG: DUF6324 family protein [Pseudomonadota bacterium]
MGINDQRDAEASLQIGPTTEGQVRLYIEGDGLSLPMDFDPDEADEIAEELRAAAEQARRAGGRGKGRNGKGGGGDERRREGGGSGGGRRGR